MDDSNEQFGKGSHDVEAHLDDAVKSIAAPLGVDVGTSKVLVAARRGKDVETHSQLNAFLTVPASAMTEATLFKFPCDFPLKVMGRRSDDFRSIVLGIVQKHAGAIEPDRIEERPSRDGNYLSLTCTFAAQSREQLDALYQELTSCERVLVVL